MSPDLKSAVTLPCFQMAGNTLESRERLNNLVNTGAILSAESLRSLELILSYPIALFVFKVLSCLKTNDSLTGVKEKSFD